MDIAAFYHSEIFKFIILPAIIFLARICDVTLDTLRIIYVSRGLKFLAPLVGFFEVLIWLMAITQILSNMTNITYYIAYAGGFAMGNFIGIAIEEKMAIGTVVIRIITQKHAVELIEFLKCDGYGVTHVDAQGAQGPGERHTAARNTGNPRRYPRTTRQRERRGCSRWGRRPVRSASP